MAEKTAVQGKNIIYLYRVLKEASTAGGTALAFTTENGRSKSKDADSTATKDGSIRTPGKMEQEITATSIMVKGDAFIPKLEDALDKDELMEIWEVNLAEPVTESPGKFKGKYFQGYLTSFEKSSNAEDMVELSLKFGINGAGVDGSVTVTAEQQTAAAYVFADAVKTGV